MMSHKFLFSTIYLATDSTAQYKKDSSVRYLNSVQVHYVKFCLFLDRSSHVLDSKLHLRQAKRKSQGHITVTTVGSLQSIVGMSIFLIKKLFSMSVQPIKNNNCQHTKIDNHQKGSDLQQFMPE